MGQYKPLLLRVGVKYVVIYVFVYTFENYVN